METKGKFQVTDAPEGVYIYTGDKKCIVPKFWGLYEKEETPIGAIIIADRNLVVALTGSDSALELLDYNAVQQGKKFESIEDAIQSFNGKEDTKLLAEFGSDAANFCLNYKYGYITQGNWYLPSIGELQLMYNHKKELDIALAICGGNAIETDDWHWSSTRRRNKSNWGFNCYNGNRFSNYQDLDYRVRPVSALLRRKIWQTLN